MEVIRHLQKYTGGVVVFDDMLDNPPKITDPFSTRGWYEDPDVS